MTPAAHAIADDQINWGDRSSQPEDDYRFAPVVPAEHFLAQWITYASGRTDAAHEFHEAAGLCLLAGATPRIRARLAPYPNGLSTNLYALLIGASTTSRKSTSKDLARDVQARALPGSLCADHFSPEGFVEAMAGRPNDSTSLYVDEFSELLDKLHHAKHMAGLRGLLLTVYAGDDYTYRRHSKRSKNGERVDDEDVLEGPHLTILGATTPVVFNLLNESDVTCGLLPRFAIVMPESKPPRRAFYEVGGDTERQRSSLVAWLHRLHEWSTKEQRVVRFDEGVLERLDTFAESVEKTATNRPEGARAMLQRLMPMAVKVAMLIAAGDPRTLDLPMLEVTTHDAAAAILIARRWEEYAVTFASRIGETDFERQVQRCLAVIRGKERVQRRTVARACHMEKRMLDSVEATLADRGLIDVDRTETGGRPSVEWTWIG